VIGYDIRLLSLVFNQELIASVITADFMLTRHTRFLLDVCIFVFQCSIIIGVTWLILISILCSICISLKVHLLVLEFTILQVLLGSLEVGDGFSLLMLKLLLDLVLL
jgi:hypothetical protein